MSDRNQQLADQYLDLFQGIQITKGESIVTNNDKLNDFFGSLIDHTKGFASLSEEDQQTLHENTQKMLNDNSLFGDPLAEDVEDLRPSTDTIKERIDSLEDQRVVPIYMLRDLLLRRVSVRERDKLPNLSELTPLFAPYIR